MRRRLVLAIVAVATAAVTLFALPLAVAVHRSYEDEELLRLQRDTVAATQGIDLGVGGADAVELPPSKDSLTVYDIRGRRVAGRGSTAADSLTRSTLKTGEPASGAHGSELAAVVPLRAAERISGAVLATRPDGVVERATHRAWLALAGLVVGVIAIATGAALVLGRRLAAPLERLAAAARRLGSGDFSVSAPRSGVSEVDAVATAMDDTAARLDDLVSRERSFSADASHQLRTPLAALRIELESLELRGDPSPELHAAIHHVDRLEGTIDTLLAVARDAPQRHVRADLVRLIDEAAGRWRGPLASAGRPLRQRVGTRPAVAAAAPEVVQEILDVLMDNASRHGAGEVSVAIRPVEGWLAVVVGDEGPGFAGDPEDAFARRISTDGGHGIGLALARSLAHAEGGRLSVAGAGPRPELRLLLRAAETA